MTHDLTESASAESTMTPALSILTERAAEWLAEEGRYNLHTGGEVPVSNIAKDRIVFSKYLDNDSGEVAQVRETLAQIEDDSTTRVTVRSQEPDSLVGEVSPVVWLREHSDGDATVFEAVPAVPDAADTARPSDHQFASVRDVWARLVLLPRFTGPHSELPTLTERVQSAVPDA